MVSKAKNISLSERAVLAKLTIHQWSAKRHDKEVSDMVSEQHKAQQDAGRYTKSLISRRALKEIAQVVSLARQTHYVLTLPWDDDGSRIMSVRGYNKYAEQMQQLRVRHEAAVRKFIKNYPDFVEEAKERLGTMYNPDDYPPPSQIKRKFGFDVEIKPVHEAGDFRAQISADSARVIAEDIERRSQQRLEEAMKDAWQRVAEQLQNMSKKLRKYNPNAIGGTTGIFKDSLVTNLQEVAEILPALNITEDPYMDQISKEIVAELCAHSSQELRDDPKLRQQTAKAAKGFYDKVKDYL